MAKDAFALSPISARAVQPGEEDYEAISEAFMETARGRWFLGEYAKRNRNADTRMVLDAVARIEQSLGSQKQQHAEDKLAHAEDRLAGALTAVKAAIDEARNAASVAIDGLGLEPNLAPVRKGARIMKEISWRWREIGADSRICDLIDQQVGAIEASCEQLGSIDPKIALDAAFDLIERRLTQFAEHDDTSAETAAAQEPVAEAAPPTPPSSAAIEVPQTAAEEVAAPEASIEAAGTIAPTEAKSEALAPAAEVQETATAELVAAETAEPVVDDAAEAADAHDEAMLDLIAMEMAVVDPVDEEEEAPAAQPVEAPAAEMVEPDPELPEVYETVEPIEETALAIPETIAPAMQPSPMPLSLQPVMELAVERPAMMRMQPSPESLAQAILEAAPEPSLGSVIVASGIIRKPISASDPLASLRRLTQAEKVALFS